MSYGSFLRIFSESTKIHREQENLKDDQRIRMGVIPPHDPQCIADDKKYESRHTATRPLGANPPGSKYSHDHRWPLYPVKIELAHDRSPQDCFAYFFVPVR